MSRFVLTGDMPKSCSECELKTIRQPKAGVVTAQCNCTGIFIADNLEFYRKESHYNMRRHLQCPLQDKRELLEAITLDIMSLIYNNHDILLYSEKLKVEDEVRNKLNKALGGEQ